jgi:hypothetical protein
MVIALICRYERLHIVPGDFLLTHIDISSNYFVHFCYLMHLLYPRVSYLHILRHILKQTN